MLKVPHADLMDDETFQRHLEARHMDDEEWSGLSSLRAGAAFSANRHVYHAYHNRLHRTKECQHEHR